MIAASRGKITIAAQTGARIALRAGAELHVIDPCGRQVADVMAVAAADPRERYCAGRTIDYNESIHLTTGSVLYSNRSRALLTIVKDDVGIHDVLLAPCSEAMFVKLRGQTNHPSCLANIAAALQPDGVDADALGPAFNAFMRVEVGSDGRIVIGAPASRAGDEIVLRAECDLVVAVTACSSEFTNAGSCKPIEVLVHDR